MPVLLSQIPAVVLALFVASGLWSGAGAFSQRFKSQTPRLLDRIAWFYILLFTMSACLATRVWVNSRVVEWSVLILLLVANIRLLRARAFDVRKIFPTLKTPAGCVLVLLLTALLLDCLYAGLPLYRYDQWTYHLVVSKWISKMGSLTGPVTYDHIFFTGSYEFLGLLARALSDSDTFQQGFQNSLSWLLVSVPAVQLFGAGTKKNPMAVISSLCFALLCIFGSGDHEALINAKPDYVLMMVALTLLLFAADGTRLTTALASFLFVAGLSFKITWLHFAVCGPIIMWGALGKNVFKEWPKVLMGGTFALPCLAPWAIKNWQFFHNPLHPAQSSLFSSTLWNPMLETYWRGITLKPEGLTAFVANMASALASLPGRWGWTCLILVGLAVLNWRRTSLINSELKRVSWIFSLCISAYVGVWGVFYGAHIFNRFVAAAFAFPIAVVWLSTRNLAASRLVPLLMIIPFFIHGQIEVTMKRLIEASKGTFEEMASTAEKGPLKKIPDLLQLAAERQKALPDAAYTHASLLSDFAFNYYGPSAFWIAADPVTWWHVEQAGIDPVSGDGMAFLRKMNIRYVWIVEPDIFSQSPPALQNVISQLEPLPSRLGRLYKVN